MHESPLFSAPAREAASAQPSRRISFRGLRRRIARLGVVAVTVASLSVAGSASAAAPFDATGCTNGTVSCISTGGALYPYLADPRYIYGSGVYGNGYAYQYGGPGAAYPYAYSNPYGYGYGYGYGVGAYGVNPYGVNAYGYGVPPCVTYDHDCDLPGSPYYGYVTTPPTAKPFSAYPSTALITPTPLPQYAPPAQGVVPPGYPPMGQAPASASASASASVATAKVAVTTGSGATTTTAVTTTPVPQQNPIIVPPVNAASNNTAGAANSPIIVPPASVTATATKTTTATATAKTTP